jgi:C2 domain
MITDYRSLKELIVTVRVISLDFGLVTHKGHVNLEAKMGSATRSSSKTIESSSKTHWKQNYTFEVGDLMPLEIRLYYKSHFFKEVNIGNCIIPTEIFDTKKAIRVSDIFNKENLKITMVWAFCIEENKYENLDYLKLINEIETEREETKYYKNKIREKLFKIKEKSKKCKEKLQKLMNSLEFQLESNQDIDKIYNTRALVIAERKLIDAKVGEMLYLKVKIQKEYEKIMYLNSLIHEDH